MGGCRDEQAAILAAAAPGEALLWTGAPEPMGLWIPAEIWHVVVTGWLFALMIGTMALAQGDAGAGGIAAGLWVWLCGVQPLLLRRARARACFALAAEAVLILDRGRLLRRPAGRGRGYAEDALAFSGRGLRRFDFRESAHVALEPARLRLAEGPAVLGPFLGLHPRLRHIGRVSPVAAASLRTALDRIGAGRVAPAAPAPGHP